MALNHRLNRAPFTPMYDLSYSSRLYFPVARLTPQLEELEMVHKRFKEEGLVVLGVPSNDFGGQEVTDAGGEWGHLSIYLVCASARSTVCLLYTTIA